MQTCSRDKGIAARGAARAMFHSRLCIEASIWLISQQASCRNFRDVSVSHVHKFDACSFLGDDSAKEAASFAGFKMHRFSSRSQRQ